MESYFCPEQNRFAGLCAYLAPQSIGIMQDVRLRLYLYASGVRPPNRRTTERVLVSPFS